MASTKLLLLTGTLCTFLMMACCDVNLEVTFLSYSVDNRDWNNNKCDLFPFGWDKCDLQFSFCIQGIGEPCNNLEMARWDDTTYISFGSWMKGVSNPIRKTVANWRGGYKFTCTVDDVDDATSNDLVDKFDNINMFKSHPGSDASSATVEHFTIMGQRRSNPSRFEFQAKAYCSPNYYSSNCSVYCTARDTVQDGHYTCDPTTGQKICLSGYENPAENCTIVKDDCLGVNCFNNGTCMDLYRNYTCQCRLGYTGRQCEVNINECASTPCLNAGQCYDLINSFTCVCPLPYTGPTCSAHVCTTLNPCVRGQCYFNNGTQAAACSCEAGYTGAHCDVRLCDMLKCQNGECDIDHCVCRPGFTALLCDIKVCDQLMCDNGGYCSVDTCTCVPGYTGSRCEVNIDDCAGRPCLNDGTCTDQVNSFLCRCLPGFVGQTCQITQNGTQPELYMKPEDESSTKPIWMIILIALVIFIIFLLIIIVVAVVCCRRKRRQANSSDTSVISETSVNDTIFTVPTKFSQLEKSGKSFEDNIYVVNDDVIITEPPSYSEAVKSIQIDPQGKATSTC